LDSDNDGHIDLFESFGLAFDAENNGYIGVLLVSGELINIWMMTVMVPITISILKIPLTGYPILVHHALQVLGAAVR